MFLNSLNIEEKNAFYSIALDVISADGILSSKEELLLSQYLEEMNIDRGSVKPVVLEDALDVIKASGDSISKKIYLELYALSMCDEDFSESEKQLLEYIALWLGLTRETASEIHSPVDELLLIYRKIGNAVQ